MVTFVGRRFDWRVLKWQIQTVTSQFYKYLLLCLIWRYFCGVAGTAHILKNPIRTFIVHANLPFRRLLKTRLLCLRVRAQSEKKKNKKYGERWVGALGWSTYIQYMDR